MNYLTLKEFKKFFDTLGIKYEVGPCNNTTSNNYNKFDRGEPCETCLAIDDPNHPYAEVRLHFLTDGSIWDYIHNDWREPDQVPDDITDEALL